MSTQVKETMEQELARLRTENESLKASAPSGSAATGPGTQAPASAAPVAAPAASTPPAVASAPAAAPVPAPAAPAPVAAASAADVAALAKSVSDLAAGVAKMQTTQATAGAETLPVPATGGTGQNNAAAPGSQTAPKGEEYPSSATLFQDQAKSLMGWS